MSDGQGEVQRIYCDLDSLLDTRLATVAFIDPAIARDFLNNPEYGYRSRNHDDLGLLHPDLDNDEFHEQYKNRGVETLMLARPTEIAWFLSSVVHKLVADMMTTPLIDDLELVVNTYPYELRDNELRDLIHALATYVGETVSIRTRYFPHTSLYPAQIKQEYGCVVMYPFIEWCEVMAPKMQTQPNSRTPEINYIVPALLRSGYEQPTEQDLDMGDGTTAEPFGAVEALMSMYMSVCYQDAKHFSAASPSEMEEMILRTRAEKAAEAQEDEQ